MKSYDSAGNLKFIRHELDSLVEARSLGTLTPVDEFKYRELCHTERELLRTIRARTPLLKTA
jgi:hypothetical protein